MSYATANKVISVYAEQLEFFKANVDKTKRKSTIVAMTNALRLRFENRSPEDIKETLTESIKIFNLINHENAHTYMLPNRAICSNLVKKFDNTLGHLSQPSDMIINTISVVSYFFYKSSKIKGIIDIHENFYDKSVRVVEYPIPSNVDFYSIGNYWYGEQGKMRVDFTMWLNRHFKLILKELENSTQT